MVEYIGKRIFMEQNEKMNENYGYNGSGTSEPDYYEEYIKTQTLQAKKTFSRCGLALLAFLLAVNVTVFIAEIAMILFLGAEKTSELLNTNVYVQYAFNVVSQYVIAFPILYYVLKPMKTMKRDRSKLRLSEFAILFFIAEFAMQVGSTIGEVVNSFFAVFKGDEVTNDVTELVNDSPIWLMILVIVIIGPIVEEIIFRKLLIDRLSRYGTTLSIIISAVAFGLFHGNFYQFFYAVAIGLVLGFMYAKTRNILYPIALHMIINFIGSVAAIPVVESLEGFYKAVDAYLADMEADISMYTNDILTVMAYSLISCAMVIAGLVFFVKYVRRKKFSLRESCEFMLPKEKSISIAFGNAGMISFVILSFATFFLNVFY